MNNYEQMCLELDKKLAELLGWQDLKESKFLSPHNYSGSINGNTGYMPRWTQDDGECFRLMVEHSIDVIAYKREVKTMCDDGFSENNVCEESFLAFDDRVSAYRVAIVNTVIGKLSQ